jgi:hypothetical protein
MVLFPLFILILYMCFTFVIFSIYHVWVYPFLDWSLGGRASIGYIVVAGVAILAFFINYGIHQIRDFIARRVYRNKEEYLDQGVTTKDDELEEV